MIISSYLEENKYDYITLIEAVCLTSILPFRHSKPDLVPLKYSKSDLHTNHPAKFQKTKSKQSLS